MERAQGREPELDALALVRTPDDLDGLAGPHADYLEPVVRRYTRVPSRHEG
ncbi:hypothetical protein [Streptomyces uncialis]|uniref:hypothetical protein n=1 Tax=Streptomyces uncialis TaxID=1048205 RepID=UPI002E36F06F|nr:hypothetical protein [Streptomyces uncialis]WST69833.1 hypothetical protein OG268_21640 [Streptomyces uncialis]